MASLTVRKNSDATFSWQLSDGEVLGESFRTFRSEAEATMALLLARMGSQQIKTSISKPAPGGIVWTGTIQGGEVAKSARSYPDRGACTKAAKTFLALLAVADVPARPQQPTAAISVLPVTNATPLTSDFDGSASQAPGSVIAAWEWTFGDGSAGQGSTVRHTFVAPGQYTVGLTVRDLHGASASAQRAVTLSAPASTQAGTDLRPPPIDRSGVTRVFESAKFLWAGDGAVQTGVAPDAIRPNRAAVLRGRVAARGAAGETPQALEGVTVRAKDRPELGVTRTRAGGVYDLMVNGGGGVTLEFLKDGFLPLCRRVPVPWEDYRTVRDVVLTPYAAVAFSTLSGGDGQLVHGPAHLGDNAGARRATLFFPKDVTFTTASGTPAVDLSAARVGVVEFTTDAHGPAAMPAALPPNSGYTYAVDLSVEGVDGVAFSDPVVHYVENFLRFPTGSPVPSGWYDPALDAWVPSVNGRVVEVRAIDDGSAVLDVDGKGAASPARLRALGISDEEQRQIAGLYPAGRSFWRVPLDHFSVWDLNWPFGPPGDATPPNPGDPSDAEDDANDDPPDNECGSTIRVQSQVLGEAMPLDGLPFALCYSSDRAPGRTVGFSLDIPLTGEAVPKSLRGVELEVHVAGQTLEKHFGPDPNQSYPFVWDGCDGYGRALQGRQPVTTRLGFTYDAVYQEPAEHEKSFAQYSGVAATENQARQQITLWREWKGALGTWDARGVGLGGWTLEIHHFYDQLARVLHLGDGTRRSCGTGLGDGTVAAFMREADAVVTRELTTPRGVAVDAAGAVYVLDSNATTSCVYKITPDGQHTLHVGAPENLTGEKPLAEANLDEAQGIDIGPDGCLYIADTGHHQILRVGPEGSVVKVAGGDVDGGEFSGDGGPANKAALHSPAGVAVSRDGVVYIADTENCRVRRVGTDGIITTVAGTGESGTDGDGGPAVAAQLEDPVDLALGHDGSLYIAQDQTGLVRRVAPDGTITTFAGTLDAPTDDAGDDDDENDAARLRARPALHVPLAGAAGVAAGPDGSVYVSTWTGNLPSVVWRIAPDGLMSVVAGSGKKDGAGEIPARSVSLKNPNRLAAGPDGTLYFACDECVVYRLQAPFENRVLGETVIPDETGQEMYVFDARGRHLRTLDAEDGAVRVAFEYGAAGALSAVKADGRALLTVERDPAGNATALVAGADSRHPLTLDGDGYLTGFEHPDQGAYRFTYAPGGLLASFQRPWGVTNRYDYDEAGRLIRDEDTTGARVDLIRTEHPDGFEVRTLTRNGSLPRENSFRVQRLPGGGRRSLNRCCTRLTSREKRTDGSRVQTQADGSVLTHEVRPDPRHEVYVPMTSAVEMRLPGGLSTRVAVSRRVLTTPGGAPGSAAYEDTIRFNDRDDREFRTKWDPAQRSLVCSAPDGRKSVMTFDEQRRPVRLTRTGVPDQSVSYDANGHANAVSIGDRRYSCATEADRAVFVSTDPLGRTLRCTRNPVDRTWEARRSADFAVRHRFDARGDLVEVQPPAGGAHTLAYGANGLLTQYTPPAVAGTDGAGVIRWEYDAVGQVSRITRANGITVDYAYDEAGRPVSTTGPSLDDRREFDPVTGQLKKLTSDNGLVVERTYDGPFCLGTTVSGPVQGAITQELNDEMRRASLSVAGEATEWRYDDAGFVNGVGDLAIQRDASGAITQITAGGLTLKFEYAPSGELTRQTLKNGRTPLADDVFTRDALGRITQATETRGRATRSVAYEYDFCNRLVRETRDSATTTYRYDLAGNRLSREDKNGVSAAAVDAQDRLLSFGDLVYDHDADGTQRQRKNNKTSEVWQYQFDALGKLLQATLPGGGEITYRNDAFGNRTTESFDGKLTRGFLYHDSPFPLAVLDAKGKVAARYIYATRQHVPDLIVRAEGTYLVLTDPVGSPRLVVDIGTGEIAQQMDYDAFGRVTADTRPGFQPFGFAGGLYDARTGLVRFGAREYDPETGRWLARDPFLFHGRDTNLYSYCGNDPVNKIDPRGLACKCPDMKDLPEINNALSALLWYYYGQGQPAKMGPYLLDAMKKTYPNWTPSETRKDGWYLPNDWTHPSNLTLGGMNHSVTIGGFGAQRRGNLVYVWDIYQFPLNGAATLKSMMSGDYKHAALLSANAILAMMIGSSQDLPSGGFGLPGVLNMPLALESRITGADQMPDALKALPYQLFGCFEIN